MKKVLIIILILGAVAAVIGYKMYNKPHKDAAAMESAFVMSSDSLYAEFENNEEAANTKYLDKNVEVKGEVVDIIQNEDGSSDIILSGVQCEFDPERKESLSGVQVGDEISVKGFCTGMLMEVVLIRCALSE